MNKLLLIIFSALAFQSFGELDSLPRGLKNTNQQGLQVDLKEIKARGFIRVLTRNNPACYFMHRGQLMGFEYEMAQRFAKKHGLEVIVIVPDEWGDMGKWLEDGRADLIAASIMGVCVCV